jgi:alpha-tubulin suppressor-like RCC1 family protein
VRYRGAIALAAAAWVLAACAALLGIDDVGYSAAVPADGASDDRGDTAAIVDASDAPVVVRCDAAPIALPVDASVVRIAAGRDHTCAVIAGTGRLACWGANEAAQLGYGDHVARQSPRAAVPVAATVDMVWAGGASTCVRYASGIECWGDNGSGQLGYGDQVQRTCPNGAQVPLEPSAQLAMGGSHACAATADGSVHCWGNNDAGQLGYGDRLSRFAPTVTPVLLPHAGSLGAGAAGTCVNDGNDRRSCWGRNSSSQLGLPATVDYLAPIEIRDPDDVALPVALGPQHSCYAAKGAGVRCFGYNSAGELGVPPSVTSQAPDAQAPVMADAGSPNGVVVGRAHSCTLTKAGDVFCWGSNDVGQLGAWVDGGKTHLAQHVALGGVAVQIASGTDHVCAVMASGGVKCWGRNDAGQLGQGTSLPQTGPVGVVFGQ